MNWEKNAKIVKQRLIFFLILIIAGLLMSFHVLKSLKGQLEDDYDRAKKDLYANKYDKAVDGFNKLGPNYQDVQKYLTYCDAIRMYNDKNFSNALKLFEELGDFEESQDYVQKCIEGQQQAEKDQEITTNIRERLYTVALQYIEAGKYAEAYDCFNSLSTYKDSNALAQECLDKWRLKCADHISAGIQFSGGITENGGVKFSGQNFVNEESIYNWSNVVSVAACNEIFAGLKRDGTVSVAKRKQSYNYMVDTSQWSDIVQVSVGEQLIVGLKADGTLFCQGIDEELNKAVTEGSNGWSDIIEIDTGWQHIVGLDQSGGIHIEGHNKDYLESKINEKKEEWENADIIAIATGGSIGNGNLGKGHIVALKKDGHVIAAGDDDFKQCEVTEWEDIVAISAGDYHTVGLKSDGTVVTTQKIDFYRNGINFRDSCIEIAKWENIVEISAGYGYTLALQDNGEVESAGNKNEHQRNVDDWKILLPAGV